MSFGLTSRRPASVLAFKNQPTATWYNIVGTHLYSTRTSTYLGNTSPRKPCQNLERVSIQPTSRMYENETRDLSAYTVYLRH